MENGQYSGSVRFTLSTVKPENGMSRSQKKRYGNGVKFGPPAVYILTQQRNIPVWVKLLPVLIFKDLYFIDMYQFRTELRFRTSIKSLEK